MALAHRTPAGVRGTATRDRQTASGGLECPDPLWVTMGIIHPHGWMIPIVKLGSGESRGAVLAFLQGTQAGLSASLVQHVGEKLLKGEDVSHHPFEGQGFDHLLFMQDLHTAGFGIQLQDDVMANEMSRDRVAFEINADHAVLIDFAFQMQPIQGRQPAVGIDEGRQ